LRWAAVPAAGSQFRSRDLFPQAAGALAVGQPDALAERIERSRIPEIPASRVAYVDGYGNLKTTINWQIEPAPLGARLRVAIGSAEQEAVVSDGSFAVEAGQLAFAPGSSGWSTADGVETRWTELFLRGGNAWDAFGRPPIGAHITVQTL
ncbi:MAG TPA: hypothetical protein VER55_07620, partial [Ardenticatenaceae bacterium]|nr:hypothetical protein [Ardenticatenaceae bacterium]